MRSKEMKKRRLMYSDKELYVPEEITTNILKRLPVKSLIRFQCVCELWNNLIKSQSFINDHLHYSSQNPLLIIESTPRLHLLDFNLQPRELQKPPIFESFGDFNVVGSCNGLLLLENLMCQKMDPPLFVWNPATQQVSRVPLSTMHDDIVGRYSCKSGFGFSPIVNDYVIVRIYRRNYHDPVIFGEVFSLSRWSWKGVNADELKGIIICSISPSVTIDGAILWTGVVKKEGVFVNVIVSFDIVNEVFTLIPTPDSLVSGSLHVLITIHENKVALLCMIHRVDRLGELWVLDEGLCAPGTTWRWNKRYDILCSLDTFDAWTVWRNNIVGKYFHENDLYSRDLLTNEVNRFSITYPGRVTDCYHYVESLVSVGNYYNEEASS